MLNKLSTTMWLSKLICKSLNLNTLEYANAIADLCVAGESAASSNALH